jgi:uncharacterized iron-regulated membrane protein
MNILLSITGTCFILGVAYGIVMWMIHRKSRSLDRTEARSAWFDET